MNMNTNINDTSASEVVDRADAIVSHVVDGEATAQEWMEFEALAAAAPNLWRELAEAQRDATALRCAMSAAGAAADGVSLSSIDRDVHTSTTHESVMTRGGTSPVRLNRLGAWTGWAVAAVVMIIASIQINALQRDAGVPTASNVKQTGLVNPVQTAADAWNLYMDKGREDGTVLGEMPGRMLVESRPAPQGKGFEVIYIRQVMERALVPDLYQVSGLDERGMPTLAPVRPALQKAM